MYFNFPTPSIGRTLAAERFMRPEPDAEEIIPGHWGYPGVGILCLGDRPHMRKVVEKIRANALSAFQPKYAPIWC